MKKLFTLFCFIFAGVFALALFIPSQTAYALQEGGIAKIIVSRCHLYKEADFSSDKVTYMENEQEILIELWHGDEVKIESIGEKFVFISTEENIEGYVYKYYLSDSTSQVVYPVFNASLRKDSVIFDLDKKETGYIGKKNARIYIYEGFDDDKEYTALQIVLEDGSLYNGYVLTENVNPDGVSGLLIIAISVIAAAVTVILSLLFIKKKKDKKNKRNK